MTETKLGLRRHRRLSVHARLACLRLAAAFSLWPWRSWRHLVRGFQLELVEKVARDVPPASIFSARNSCYCGV